MGNIETLLTLGREKHENYMKEAFLIDAKLILNLEICKYIVKNENCIGQLDLGDGITAETVEQNHID